MHRLSADDARRTHVPIPSAVPDVQRKSLRDGAIEQIRAAIFDGTLEPGEHLNDQDLQAWLGISRTPIREALNELARLGLIEMAAQKYTRVTLPAPENRTQVLQTLGALIGGVVRVTVPTLSDDHRALLVRALEDLVQVVDARDVRAHGTKGWAMVDLITGACPNPFLARATQHQIDALAYQLSITRTDESTDWASLDDGYPRLLNAIRTGDAIAAELAAETILRL